MEGTKEQVRKASGRNDVRVVICPTMLEVDQLGKLLVSLTGTFSLAL